MNQPTIQFLNKFKRDRKGETALRAYRQQTTGKAFLDLLRSAAVLAQYTSQPQWQIDRLSALIEQFEASQPTK